MIDSFMKIIDPNFISAETIGGVGSEIVVTIKDIDYAECLDPRSKKTQTKQTLFFVEDVKPMVLNKTNAKMLKKLFSPDEDDPRLCVGKRIRLVVEKVRLGRDMVDGIRIKEYADIKCENCGADIVPAANRTITQLVSISKKNCGGKVLCIKCMNKYAKEEQK